MHFVNLILIRKSELRNSKISSIIDGGDFPNLDIPYLVLPQDIIAFPTLEKADVCKNFGSGVTFMAISTDYFGGPGNQSASLNETIIYDNNFHYKTLKTSHVINKILYKYGVICENGQDEFDSINLGRYRTNEEYIKEIKTLRLIEKLLVTAPKF